MPTQQMKLDLIPHQLNGSVIDQRSKDGYINATALCKAAGKEWAAYKRNGRAKRFLNALCADMQICMSDLIQEIRGGHPHLQGTWIHPKVAINLGMWLSPEFEVKVTNWVHEWMSDKSVVLDTTPPRSPSILPPHIRRYVLNQAAVPAGHFTVLQEITFLLTGPMEILGHELAEHFLPDGSLGKMFCAHLREVHGIPTADFVKYIHRFEDGRKVPANAYPNELLSIFRKYALEFWLPKHAPKYYRDRDPAALAFLAQLPALSSPSNTPTFKPLKYPA